MIAQIQISNFKCFDHIKLQLGDLTLLSGLNGMGKSSLIQTLLLLRQSHQQGLLDNIGLALNGDLVHVGTAQDALFEGAAEDKIGFEINMFDGAFGSWQFNYDRKSDVMSLADKQLSKNIYEKELFNDNFQYLQAERTGPRRFYETSEFHVRQHRQLGTRGEYSIHFLQNFGKEAIACQSLYFPGLKSDELKHHVEAWIGEVSPGTRIETDSDTGTDTISLRYAFEAGKLLTRPYRSTNVGFGITYTLPVIIALLSSRPGSLVILENPEAHLHPKGQVMIGRLLSLAAVSGVQVVVETHSDQVLNGVRLSVYDGVIDPNVVRLHFFERTVSGSSKTIEPKIDQNGRIDKWPKGFFDEWDNSLKLLIKPRPA